MTRVMIDAADPGLIPRAMAYQLVAGYRTGTPGMRWKGHFTDFPGKTMVDIDQAAAPGAPDYNAIVMDVEPLCYRPNDIPARVSRWTVARPTVYCDRNDYPEVRMYWEGDIWLAAPGVQSNPYPNDHKIVAIQNRQTPDYDLSTVFDDTWPNTPTPPPPPTEVDMISGMINAGAETFIPFPAGAFKSLLLMHDFTTSPNLVRVAVYSKSAGHYTQIVEQDVTTSNPSEVAFTATDPAGVSLVNRSTVPMGYTLA